MTYSLRLPPGLDSDARAEATRLGISLNGLVCVALDQYLKGRSGGDVRPGQALRELAVREGVPQLGVLRGLELDRRVDAELDRATAVVPKKQPSDETPEQLLVRSRAGQKLAKPDSVRLTAWMRERKRAGLPIPGYGS